MRRLTRVSALVLAIALLGGCAAGKAFGRGEDAREVGDWDSAVPYYRTAVQADPERAEYRIGLERAMLNASRLHFDKRARVGAKDQLDAALLEYRRTSSSIRATRRRSTDRAARKIIRDRAEASRPKPAIALLREQARQVSPTPLLNPASRARSTFDLRRPACATCSRSSATPTGINVIYDASFNDRPVTVQLTGSIEQALSTLLSSNGLFYSVLDERTIVVAQDSAPNRLKYERQVALTIPLSYADATELAAMLTAITRTTTGVTIPPVIVPNKTNNSITIRATEPVVAVIRELVLTNDKPRAEITLDVEILEVSRSRTKELGLNLSLNQIGGIFSPEKLPRLSARPIPALQPEHDHAGRQRSRLLSHGAAGHRQVPADGRQHSISRSDAVAWIRGRAAVAEGGRRRAVSDDVLFPNRGGGANVNPLSSYSFRTVGISVQATPRLITDEGDILMDLVMSNDTLGPPRLVGGQAAPSFPTRSVTTKLRLRDGESHLLAGLLQDDERRAMTGFPGVMNIPVLRSIFGASDDIIAQTDIVMLLTPRIIRTHEYTRAI
jgi:general secretion pathway protein D